MLLAEVKPPLTQVAQWDKVLIMDEPKGTALVNLPAESTLGPAMRALPTDGQRKFVIALLELGTMNFTRAALMAGYSGNGNTLNVTAHRLAHDEKVLAAIHEESHRRLHSGKMMAVSVLLNLAEKALKDSDKLKAIDMVLNKTGLHDIRESIVITRDDSTTDEAMIARITHLAKVLGVDPTKLLGQNTQAPIEGDFTVVEPATADGLEDML